MVGDASSVCRRLVRWREVSGRSGNGSTSQLASPTDRNWNALKGGRPMYLHLLRLRVAGWSADAHKKGPH